MLLSIVISIAVFWEYLILRLKMVTLLTRLGKARGA